MDVDPQVATAFLSTLAQIAAALFAVYMALIIFTVQDRKLAKRLIKKRSFQVLFVLSSVVFTFFIASLLREFLFISSSTSYSDNVVRESILFFVMLCSFLCGTYWIIMSEKAEEVS